MFTACWVRCLWVLAACALALGALAAEKDAVQEKSITVDLGGGVKMELVLIPAGSFRMGSEKGEANEKPFHEVKIPKPFYMGKYEVTQEQWQAVMGNYPAEFKGAKYPAQFVSWERWQAFLGKLNQRVQRGRFTLPSEAEWDYACGAGSKTEFCFGDDEKLLGEHAWFEDNSEKKPHPVGEKKPNAWGLFDMHGNLWEWCEDMYHENYQGAPNDGSAWLLGGRAGHRVLRGGSWDYSARVCRSASRTGCAWAGSACRVVLRDF